MTLRLRAVFLVKDFVGETHPPIYFKKACSASRRCASRRCFPLDPGLLMLQVLPGFGWFGVRLNPQRTRDLGVAKSQQQIH